MFFQRSSGSDSELAVVRAAARRDALIDDIHRLHLQSRRLGIVEDAVWTRLLQLIVWLRTATLEVLRAVSLWQLQFTRPHDFTLHGVNYISSMVSRTDFLASLKLRHHLGFEIRRGNVFVLPLKGSSRSQVAGVSGALSEALQAWSNPDEEELREAYRLLRSLLPPAAYRRVLPPEEWLDHRWTPSVIKSSKATRIKPRSYHREQSGKPDGVVESEVPVLNKVTFGLTTESLRLEYSRYFNSTSAL